MELLPKSTFFCDHSTPICRRTSLLVSCSQSTARWQRIVDVHQTSPASLQDQHEVVSVARLHHDPVHGSGKVDVSCQEHDVLPVQGCDGPMNLDQVGHHVLQGSLPFTTGSWTRTRLWTELATVLVLHLLRVKHRGSATDVVVLAGELDCAGRILPPSWPRQVGQHVNFGRQLEQTKCPA